MWGVYLEFATCVSAIFKLRWLRILLNTLTARMCSIGNVPCLGNADLSVFRIRVYALPFPARKALLLFYLQYMHLSNPPCASPWTRRTPYTSVVCFVCGLMSPLFHVYWKKTKIKQKWKGRAGTSSAGPDGREARAVISQKKKHSNPPYEL